MLSLEDKDSDDAPNEMALLINRDMTSSIGVNPNEIAGAVSGACADDRWRILTAAAGRFPVKMRFEEDRAELDDVNNYKVRIEDGRYVSVGTAFTRPAMLKANPPQTRNNKKVSYYINMKLKSGEEREARRAIYEAQKNIDLPEDVSF